MTSFHPFIQNPGAFYVDGKWVAVGSSDVAKVVNPATEELLALVPLAQPDDMSRAIQAARKAYDHGPWPKLTPDERGEYLVRIAAELDARSDAHARIWTSEIGVTFNASQNRMNTLGASYSSFAKVGKDFSFSEEHRQESNGRLIHLEREPVGVVGAIVAWNGAPGQIAAKVAPALMAGCTIIVKSPPEAPGSAHILAEACQAADLPAGVVNFVTADREVSELLVRHPAVDKITFTGSTNAGRRIAAICGERLARCTLELGGKSPALVLDDFDLELAAKRLAAKCVLMSGQVCFALTRITISRHRHDAFLEALKHELDAVKLGDPYDSETQMGPLASESHLNRVEEYIRIGINEGAALVAGGQRPSQLKRGYYLEPTIFGNVDNSARISREEIFGPVLSVIPVRDDNDAVSVANDTQFGLNAAVFTNDREHAFQVAKRIQSGTVGHNDLRREHRMPFGGFKSSGIGREGGKDGLLSYLETKVILME